MITYGWNSKTNIYIYCYLVDTLDGYSGEDLVATAIMRNGWIMFREFLLFLTSRVPLLEMNDPVSGSCFKSSMTSLDRC